MRRAISDGEELPDLAAKNPGIICDFPASTHLSNLHKTFYL